MKAFFEKNQQFFEKVLRIMKKAVSLRLQNLTVVGLRR